MIHKHSLLSITRLAAAALLLLSLIMTAPVSAAPVSAARQPALRDRKPPTAPSNFRVTAVTPFSVSLAWKAASDNSGSFTYRLWSTAGPTVTLPKTATGYTWSSNIAPRNTYTFGLYAVDAAGNNSKQVTLSIRTPPDTSAPSAPVVTVGDVGSTYVTLNWSPAQDDGPFLFYRVYRDGSLLANGLTATGYTAQLLQPQTGYTFTVQAYDYGPNYSPHSSPVTVTTDPVDTGDTTPPTMPGSLREDHWDDGEIHLDWVQSTDNRDAQANIRYDIIINGVLDHAVVGRGSTITYILPGHNVIQVIAVDTAGNASPPAVITVDL